MMPIIDLNVEMIDIWSVFFIISKNINLNITPYKVDEIIIE